jgi:hypothetical protein
MSQAEAGGAERIDGVLPHRELRSKPAASGFPEDTADDAVNEQPPGVG